MIQAKDTFSKKKKHTTQTTHLFFSKAFTVVSLARELTKLTTSAKMEGSRKCEAMSAVHCWMEAQPVPQQPRQKEQKVSSRTIKPFIHHQKCAPRHSFLNPGKNAYRAEPWTWSTADRWAGTLGVECPHLPPPAETPASYIAKENLSLSASPSVQH